MGNASKSIIEENAIGVIIMADEPEEIEFEAINEPWSRYKLADGTIFEVRLILTTVRPDLTSINQTEKPIYNYLVNHVARVVGSRTTPKNGKVLS